MAARTAAGPKVVVITGAARSLVNFRRELLEEMVRLGCEVTALAPRLEASSFARTLRTIGVRTLTIRMEHPGVSPSEDLRMLSDLVRFLRLTGPDIVLSYALKPVVYGSIAARIARVPRIYSLITGLGYTFADSSAGGTLLRAALVVMCRGALQGNDVVMFQNPDDLALFRQRQMIAPTQKTMTVNGSGVNLERFSFQPVTAQPPTFLLMSRLLEAKGIHEYAEAAQRLKRRYPFARFQLLGGQMDEPGWISRKQVQAWVDEGVLEVIGRADDVLPFLAACTVVVLPSYREGTPRSVLEGLAVGRPVITTDAPGCRETVVEGENGFLIPPRDVPSLVAAMEKFILQPELAVRMGAASRRFAEEKYDVRRVNEVMLQAMGIS